MQLASAARTDRFDRSFKQITYRGLVQFALLISCSWLIATAEANDETVIVWSEPVGEDYEIFGSFAIGDEWGEPVRLVAEPETDILPCAMPLGDGDSTLVVWTKMHSFEESYLVYVIWKKGELPSEPRLINTEMKINTGVSMVKDAQGTVWLSWAGYDGSDDDIYVLRFEGGEWTPPARINLEDNMPDITANLGLDENSRPWISWMGLDSNGYRRYFSKHDGQSWTDEIPLSDSKAADYKLLLSQRLQQLPTPPRHVPELEKACMTFLDGHTIQTMRYPFATPESGETPPAVPIPADNTQGDADGG